MTVNKRKKFSRQRGSHTHGWGAKKKHRGAGNRGGRGAAGRGKKGDANKPSIWKEEYFGRHQFRCVTSKEEKAINVIKLEESISTFLKDKKAKEENGTITINLKELGYTKLLGKGKITKRFKIIVEKATERAIETVKNAGGEVVLPEEENKDDKRVKEPAGKPARSS